MDQIDTLVIGAGVIGLACGAKLSTQSDVLVIEQQAQFGEHTSSRNSEVVHAGIYYPTNSLKAQLCVQGKSSLYRHCQKYNVPVNKIGKLLIANGEQEIEKLHALYQQAGENGMPDLHFMNRSELEEKAPQIRVQEALWSPSTGIIDSHQLMLSYIHQIESNGGQYVGNTRFLSAHFDGHHFIVSLECSGEIFTLQCKHLINAAGLFAQQCAQNITELALEHIPKLYFCKGQYFNYQGKHPFKHLIYPMPEQHGLGIHATLDLAGQLKFGPDTEFVDKLDYAPSEHNKANFVNAISRYWPTINESRLHASYSGIRPKLHHSGAQDFVIQDSQTHGLSGLINLFGIESPGLTASLAIADRVAEKLLS